jgi:hypothetical protein
LRQISACSKSILRAQSPVFARDRLALRSPPMSVSCASKICVAAAERVAAFHSFTMRG